MKNTSLFVSFWAMPKRKPSVESAKRNWVKRHACFRGYRGHGVMPPNRQFSAKSGYFSRLLLPLVHL